MTRERIGRFCIILGGLCILAAAFLLGFNLREERRAAAATQKILPAVAHSIGQSPAPMPTLPAGELTVSLEGEEYLGILSPTYPGAGAAGGGRMGDGFSAPGTLPLCRYPGRG